MAYVRVLERECCVPVYMCLWVCVCVCESRASVCGVHGGRPSVERGEGNSIRLERKAKNVNNFFFSFIFNEFSPPKFEFYLLYKCENNAKLMWHQFYRVRSAYEYEFVCACVSD